MASTPASPQAASGSRKTARVGLARGAREVLGQQRLAIGVVATGRRRGGAAESGGNVAGCEVEEPPKSPRPAINVARGRCTIEGCTRWAVLFQVRSESLIRRTRSRADATPSEPPVDNPISNLRTPRERRVAILARTSASLPAMRNWSLR